MLEMVAYLEIFADILKKLFTEWDDAERVAKRFIAFMDTVTLTILGKI